MTESFTIGPRQTVDRCKHPSLGEGRAVYDNGPAAFLADSGEVVPLHHVSPGGAGTATSSRGRYEHIVAHPIDGSRSYELDTLDRQKGPRHRRIVSPMTGPAWLVTVCGADDGDAFMVERVEPDSGAPTIVLHVRQMYAGKPPFKSRKKKQDGENEGWLTLEAREGTFTYQNEERANHPPAPKAEEKPPPRSKKSGEKKAKKPKAAPEAKAVPVPYKPCECLKSDCPECGERDDALNDADKAPKVCLSGFGEPPACGRSESAKGRLSTDDTTKVTCPRCIARMHDKPQIVNWYTAQRRAQPRAEERRSA